MNSHSASSRLASIDLLRGLVMVLMTLDHTRDFFSAAHFKPTDLDKTTLALFLTRWVTHYCAPVFVFLAGTSAYLWWMRRGPEAPISRFLLQRGVLLLALTITVEAWAWNFRNDFRMIDGGVLWAIAWSMIALAGLVKLRLRGLMVFGGAMILLHNAFDTLKVDDLGAFGPWWAVLHTGDDVLFGNGWGLNPFYPLIPWIGVMAVGFGFGHWFADDGWRNRRRLLMLGGALCLAFLSLRFSNLYGDPTPWQVYADPLWTLKSFLNCHKYPPSLAYLLMTLGPALLFLGFVDGLPRERFAALQVFGRTPLLFYLLHLYVIHGLAVAVAWLTHGPVDELLGGGIWSPTIPQDYGYDLPGVYGFWLIVLALMYPVCKGFEALKVGKPHWVWLKYL